MRITEHADTVDRARTAWRQAGDPPAPILYVHGVPTASWDWIPFLERTGGFAPDLPGFGGSSRPPGFSASIEAYDRFVEAFTAHTGLDRLTLVVHDWGGAALAFAQRFPHRIERLVLISSVAFVPGYRWHWVARAWRTPRLGELFMAGMNAATINLITRQATASHVKAMPADWRRRVVADLTPDMKRTILELYRSAPEERLAAAGHALDKLTCPALILWPDRDPYLPTRLGRQYAEALGGETTYETIEHAGHWPWIDQPSVVDRVAAFVA